MLITHQKKKAHERHFVCIIIKTISTFQNTDLIKKNVTKKRNKMEKNSEN